MTPLAAPTSVSFPQAFLAVSPTGETVSCPAGFYKLDPYIYARHGGQALLKTSSEGKFFWCPTEFVPAWPQGAHPRLTCTVVPTRVGGELFPPGTPVLELPDGQRCSLEAGVTWGQKYPATSENPMLMDIRGVEPPEAVGTDGQVVKLKLDPVSVQRNVFARAEGCALLRTHEHGKFFWLREELVPGLASRAIVTFGQLQTIDSPRKFQAVNDPSWTSTLQAPSLVLNARNGNLILLDQRFFGMEVRPADTAPADTIPVTSVEVLEDTVRELNARRHELEEELAQVKTGYHKTAQERNMLRGAVTQHALRVLELTEQLAASTDMLEAADERIKTLTSQDPPMAKELPPTPLASTAAGSDPGSDPAAHPVLRALRTDAEAAAWRTAGSQFVKLARTPLVGLLSRHLAPGDEALRGRIAAFVETEVGTAMLTALLSVGLSTLPTTGSPVPEKLARELRVSAMADTADVAADLIMGPLRQVMALYLQDLPGIAAEGAATANLPAPKAPLVHEVESLAIPVK